MRTLLSPVEARVLGCLMEKKMATPEYYPLTLNALTAACNQKSNRDPVMALSPGEVEAVIDGLRHTHKLALMVMTSGSRTQKYAHTVQEEWGLTDQQTALLCLLLLRGPQTSAELRTRSARLCQFSDAVHVETTLESLADPAQSPIFRKCQREPGRRERRWTHMLCAAAAPEAEVQATLQAEQGQPETPADAGRLTALEAEVRSLRESLNALAGDFAEFKKQLG